ncbi:hypothetical protein VNI00_017818 [Paramarasmius palmivorus]|uniref:NAD(P)-binding protein n=1 Tax=Paramarasmius palmivorus TaxID=297713 RepID=A0AAW0B3L2_9AGAR
MTSALDIRDDVAFVTGAASGIGRAIATELAGRADISVRLILTDIDESALRSLVSDLNSKFGDHIAIGSKVDTSSWEEQLAAYELGKQAFGRVDYFFANAGIVEHMWLPAFNNSASTSSGPIIRPNLRTLEVDLVGQLYTAALALQVFQRQTPNRHGFRGKLIITASVYGFYASDTMPLYSASKAGILHFARSASTYYGDKDITINCSTFDFTLRKDQLVIFVPVCPNATETKIAPEDFFVPFKTQNLLTPIELIIEQCISLLGNNKDNGKAIGIVGQEVWTHPDDNYKRRENEPAFKLIDHSIGQAFGYWK